MTRIYTFLKLFHVLQRETKVQNNTRRWGKTASLQGWNCSCLGSESRSV